VLLNQSLNEIEVLISIGIGLNTYFEEHWIRTFSGVKFVQMFDKDISSLPFKVTSKQRWLKESLGGADKKEESLYSMHSLLNHADAFDKKMVLKLNCGGCEWEAFAQMDEGTLKEFDQIVIEFNGVLGRGADMKL